MLCGVQKRIFFPFVTAFCNHSRSVLILWRSVASMPLGVCLRRPWAERPESTTSKNIRPSHSDPWSDAMSRGAVTHLDGSCCVALPGTGNGWHGYFARHCKTIFLNPWVVPCHFFSRFRCSSRAGTVLSRLEVWHPTRRIHVDGTTQKSLPFGAMPLPPCA